MASLVSRGQTLFRAGRYRLRFDSALRGRGSGHARLGKPAWLDPHLPVPDVLTCRKCGKPRVFLLQVYAPIDHLAHNYHRMLYVFCSREPSCHSRNFTEQFLVLRCNLPQLHSSYDSMAKRLSDGSAINDKDEPDATNSSTRNNSKNGLAVTIHSIAQYDLAPEDATTIGNSK